VVLTEATQWFKNGDHPKDESTPIDNVDGAERLTEGKIIGFFRNLNIPGGRHCPECGNIMEKHGTLFYGRTDEVIICPSDYIVTDRKGDYYRVPANEFDALYEPTRPT
jgi:hypothetical protein